MNKNSPKIHLENSGIQYAYFLEFPSDKNICLSQCAFMNCPGSFRMVLFFREWQLAPPSKKPHKTMNKASLCNCHFSSGCIAGFSSWKWSVLFSSALMLYEVPQGSKNTWLAAASISPAHWLTSKGPLGVLHSLIKGLRHGWEQDLGVFQASGYLQTQLLCRGDPALFLNISKSSE